MCVNELLLFLLNAVHHVCRRVCSKRHQHHCRMAGQFSLPLFAIQLLISPLSWLLFRLLCNVFLSSINLWNVSSYITDALWMVLLRFVMLQLCNSSPNHYTAEPPSKNAVHKLQQLALKHLEYVSFCCSHHANFRAYVSLSKCVLSLVLLSPWLIRVRDAEGKSQNLECA